MPISGSKRKVRMGEWAGSIHTRYSGEKMGGKPYNVGVDSTHIADVKDYKQFRSRLLDKDGKIKRSSVRRLSRSLRPEFKISGKMPKISDKLLREWYNKDVKRYIKEEAKRRERLGFSTEEDITRGR